MTRVNPRSASTTGVNGSGLPPTGTQPPVKTNAPCAAARRQNSAVRRDLPIPASPAISTVGVSPSAARASAASSARDCAARPMNSGLEIRLIGRS